MRHVEIVAALAGGRRLRPRSSSRIDCGASCSSPRNGEDHSQPGQSKLLRSPIWSRPQSRTPKRGPRLSVSPTSRPRCGGCDAGCAGTDPVNGPSVRCTTRHEPSWTVRLAAILRFHDDRTVTVMAGPRRRTGAQSRHSRRFRSGFVIDGCTRRTERRGSIQTIRQPQTSLRSFGGSGSARQSVVRSSWTANYGGSLSSASLDRFSRSVERRLADFTELVATAIANAEQVRAVSLGRRIVAASDESRADRA